MIKGDIFHVGRIKLHKPCAFVGVVRKLDGVMQLVRGGDFGRAPLVTLGIVVGREVDEVAVHDDVRIPVVRRQRAIPFSHGVAVVSHFFEIDVVLVVASEVVVRGRIKVSEGTVFGQTRIKVRRHPFDEIRDSTHVGVGGRHGV